MSTLETTRREVNMTPEQQAAYIFSQSVSALIEAMGMLSDNLDRARKGESPGWNNDEFNYLIDKYGISHNAVTGLYRQ